MKHLHLTYAKGLSVRAVALMALAWATACTPIYLVSDRQVKHYKIDAQYSGDASVESFVKPYRDSMAAIMGEVLVYSEEGMQKAARGTPQGKLGNLVADLMLNWGRKTLEPNLDFALTNDGGLRTDLPKGAVTLGRVYEIMPFDNVVAVATLNKAQFDSLVAVIASGEDLSFSGLKVTAVGGKATEVLVNGKPYDGRDLRCVMTDYLMDGGSNLSFMKNTTARVNTGIFFRDFIADYFRNENKEGRKLVGIIDDRNVRQAAP